MLYKCGVVLLQTHPARRAALSHELDYDQGLEMSCLCTCDFGLATFPG